MYQLKNKCEFSEFVVKFTRLRQNTLIFENRSAAVYMEIYEQQITEDQHTLNKSGDSFGLSNLLEACFSRKWRSGDDTVTNRLINEVKK